MVRLVIKKRKRRNASKMCAQADFAFPHRNCRNQRFSEKSIRKWFWGRRMLPAAGLGGWGSFSRILLDSRPVLLDFSSILSSLLMSSSILLGPTPRFSWVAPRFSSILLDSSSILLDFHGCSSRSRGEFQQSTGITEKILIFKKFHEIGAKF